MWHNHESGLPPPYRGVHNQSPTGMGPTPGRIGSGAHDLGSQTDWPQSPNVAAATGGRPETAYYDKPAENPGQSEHQVGSPGEASMLRHLESVHQVADAIAERLGIRMLQQAAAGVAAHGRLAGSSLHGPEQGKRHETNHEDIQVQACTVSH